MQVDKEASSQVVPFSRELGHGAQGWDVGSGLDIFSKAGLLT